MTAAHTLIKHPGGLLGDPALNTFDVDVGGQLVRIVWFPEGFDVDEPLPPSLAVELCGEPRGHQDDVLAYVAPLTSDDLLVRFADLNGPIHMCGEGLLSVTELLRHSEGLGLGEAGAPGKNGRYFHTAVGEVRAIAGPAEAQPAVSLPPSSWDDSLTVRHEAARLPVYLATGAGNRFAIIDIADTGLVLSASAVTELRALALGVREQLRLQLGPDAPSMVQIADLAGQRQPSNIVIWGEGGNIDRGPCGTGSAARAALLCGRGEMAAGEALVSTGLSGEAMTVRVLDAGRPPGADVIVSLSARARLISQSIHYFTAPDARPRAQKSLGVTL